MGLSSTLYKKNYLSNSVIVVVMLLSIMATETTLSAECGEIINDGYLGVPVKSNAPFQGTSDVCGNDGVENEFYGYEWQCVEYVKRFYSEGLKVPGVKAWSGHARSYYTDPTPKGLVAYDNGGAVRPRAGDILVFDDPARKYGHVSIISYVPPETVNPSTVEIVEQNWGNDGSATVTLEERDGKYTVTRTGTPYTVLGWSRRKPTTSISVIKKAEPRNSKDVWTTSVFSYDGSPNNIGFGGGGLDNEELRVGGWGDLYYSLLEFDISGLPETASSAYVEIHPYTKTNERRPVGMYLYRITGFWDWRTMGSGPDRERLWWVDRPPAVPWTADEPQPMPAPISGEPYRIDITNLYNAWQADNNNINNFGIQLRPTGNFANQNFFRSSEYMGDPSLRPKLVVTPSSTYSESKVLFESAGTGTAYDITANAGNGSGLYSYFPFWDGVGPFYPASGEGHLLTEDVRYLRIKRVSGVSCDFPFRVFITDDSGNSIIPTGGSGRIAAVGNGPFCDFDFTSKGTLMGAGMKFWRLGFCLNNGCDGEDGTLRIEGSPSNQGYLVDGTQTIREPGGWAFQLCGDGGCTDF